MLSNKYGAFLTVLLVIILVGVTAGLIFLGIRTFGGGESPEDAVSRFINDVTGNNDDDDNEPGYIGDINVIANPGNNASGNANNSNRRRPRQFYRDFVMVGTIEIPRTGIRYPILERGTDRSLDVSVAVMWPGNPEDRLNEPGNVVIMGHNYRNGRFFSNNQRLSIGDVIHITDVRGRRVTYTIYEMFETTAVDTSYITRDTGGATEITLTTCTDDSVNRLIVKARAQGQ